MPAVGVGLRLHLHRFAEVIPAHTGALVAALDQGDLIGLDGTTVWTALLHADPDQADQFRRAHGWRPGLSAGWELVDNTRWTYDPRSGLLSPDDQETT